MVLLIRTGDFEVRKMTRAMSVSRGSSTSVVFVQVLLSIHAAMSPFTIPTAAKEISMSKGMNQKKAERKKPAKSLLEKRAAKKTKRDEKASYRGA